MKIALKYILSFLIVVPVICQNHVLSLDGIDDYVEFSETIIFSNSFTIEAWVYLEGPGGGIEGRSLIFEQRSDATGCNNSGITFFAETKPNERTERFGLRGSAGCSIGLFNESPSYGEWHYYVAVQDGAGDYSSVYLDGVLRASLYYDHQGNFSTNIDHVSLGTQTHDQNGYGFLNGMMDDVRIWDYALDESEIIANMTGIFTGTEPGLLALWDFENSSEIVLDQSDNGHNGSLLQGASVIEADVVAESVVWGDYNLDGLVNISDVIILINHILGF